MGALKLYNFSTDNGEFLGTTQAEPDPEGDGWIIPWGTTEDAPPSARKGTAAVYSFSDREWQILPDHRGETWFEEGGRPVQIAGFGDPSHFQPSLSSTRPAPPPEPDPTSCTRLGLKRAFGDRWPAVRQFINSDEDRKEEWDLAVTVEVSDHLVQDAIAHFQMTDDEVKALIRAAVAAVEPAAS